jgi:hypothetical protein
MNRRHFLGTLLKSGAALYAAPALLQPVKALPRQITLLDVDQFGWSGFKVIFETLNGLSFTLPPIERVDEPGSVYIKFDEFVARENLTIIKARVFYDDNFVMDYANHYQVILSGDVMKYSFGVSLL